MRQHGLMSLAAALLLLLLSSSTTPSAGTSAQAHPADEELIEEEEDFFLRPDHEDQTRLLNSSDLLRENVFDDSDPHGLGRNCNANDSKSCADQEINSNSSQSFSHSEINQTHGSHFQVKIKKNQSKGSISYGIKPSSPTPPYSSPFNPDEEILSKTSAPVGIADDPAEIALILKTEDRGEAETRVPATSPKNNTQHTTIQLVTSNNDSDQFSNPISKVNDESTAAGSSTTGDDATRGRFLVVGVAWTLVISTAATVTATVRPTCYAAAMGILPCPGRRSMRRTEMMNKTGGEYDEVLDSSLATDMEISKSSRDRSSRFILWSSVTTTIFFTSTVTSGSTVMASVGCSFTGLATMKCP